MAKMTVEHLDRIAAQRKAGGDRRRQQDRRHARILLAVAFGCLLVLFLAGLTLNALT
jgi:hypothetical protein